MDQDDGILSDFESIYEGFSDKISNRFSNSIEVDDFVTDYSQCDENITSKLEIFGNQNNNVSFNQDQNNVSSLSGKQSFQSYTPNLDGQSSIATIARKNNSKNNEQIDLQQRQRSWSFEDLSRVKQTRVQLFQSTNGSFMFRSLTILNKPKLIKEGYVMKKIQKTILGFRKRFFQLYENKLLYFRDHQQRQQIDGCISFLNYNCSISSLAEDKFQIILEGIKRKFIFKTQDPHWSNVIRNQIELVKNVKRDRQIPVLKKDWRLKYLKQDLISQQEFHKQTETGDIFCLKKLRIGFFQHLLNKKSKFDMCFMIYKENSNSYLISYDSKGLVSIHFDIFLEQLQGQIDQIAVRRLHYIDKLAIQDNFLNKISSIIAANKYKPKGKISLVDNTAVIVEFYKNIGILKKNATTSNTQFNNIKADKFLTEKGSWFSHHIAIYPERYQDTKRMSM